MPRTLNSICAVCGKKFYKRPSQKTGKDFCSISCYGVWKTKPKLKKCENCDKTFQYKRRDQRFCSLFCAANRPRSERKSGVGKNKSQGILERLSSMGWGGKCMIVECDYSKTMDVHRVINGKEGGKYTDDNACAICPNHHAEIHRLNCNINKIGKFRFEMLGPGRNPHRFKSCIFRHENQD